MSTCNDLNRAIQTRLADLGYYRLRIDGIHGPGTSSAVVRFKAAHGLRARDYVGPQTLTLLFGKDAKPAPMLYPVGNEPAWLTEARKLLGTREVAGSRSNPAIMTWARDLDQWYPGDDVPWCGLFVAHCMSVGAPDTPQNFNRLGARAWGDYGVKAGFDLGAICTLWRTHPEKSWHGHVFIVTGIADDAVRGIGGNQGDTVSETWFSRDRVLALRKPDVALKPAPRATKGTLSTNEA